ncbi:putative paramyosin [Toxoplasma gondii VAND]|uniref:Putative paramyosin n=1 Tax=Toxoplasma gondii VAND TaxID=933077 RepID=A0A086QF93_TOXGO|nr:putative paramyosin [Toxoplasma gondii VAND]
MDVIHTTSNGQGRLLPSPCPGSKKLRLHTDNSPEPHNCLETVGASIHSLSLTIKNHAVEANPLNARLQKHLLEIRRELAAAEKFEAAVEKACKPLLLSLENLVGSSSDSSAGILPSVLLTEKMVETASEVRSVIDTVFKKRDSLSVKRDRLKEQVEEAAALMNSNQGEVKQIKQEIKKISQHAKERIQEQEHLLHSCTSLAEMARERCQQCEELEAKCCARERDINSLQTNLEAAKLGAEKEKQMKAVLLGELHKQLDSVRHANCLKSEEALSLVQKLTEVEDILQRDRASLSMIKCQTDSQAFCLTLLDKRITDMETDFPSLQQTLTDLQTELNELSKTLNASASELPAVRKEIYLCEETLTNIRLSTQEKEQRNVQLHEENAALVQMLHQRHGQSENLSMQAEEIRSELELLQSLKIEKEDFLLALPTEAGVTLALSGNVVDRAAETLTALGKEILQQEQAYHCLLDAIKRTESGDMALKEEIDVVAREIQESEAVLLCMEEARRVCSNMTAERLQTLQAEITTKEHALEELVKLQRLAEQTKTEKEKQEMLIAEVHDRYNRVKEALTKEHTKKIEEIMAPNSIVRTALEQREVAECDAMFRAESTRLRSELSQKVEEARKKLSEEKETLRKEEACVSRLRTELEERTLLPFANNDAAEGGPITVSLTFSDGKKTLKAMLAPETGDAKHAKSALDATGKRNEAEQAPLEGLKSPHLSALREKLFHSARLPEKGPLDSLLHLKRTTKGHGASENASARPSSHSSFAKFSRSTGPFYNLGCSSIRKQKTTIFTQSLKEGTHEIDIFSP